MRVAISALLIFADVRYTVCFVGCKFWLSGWQRTLWGFSWTKPVDSNIAAPLISLHPAEHQLPHVKPDVTTSMCFQIKQLHLLKAFCSQQVRNYIYSFDPSYQQIFTSCLDGFLMWRDVLWFYFHGYIFRCHSVCFFCSIWFEFQEVLESEWHFLWVFCFPPEALHVRSSTLTGNTEEQSEKVLGEKSWSILSVQIFIHDFHSVLL